MSVASVMRLGRPPLQPCSLDSNTCSDNYFSLPCDFVQQIRFCFQVRGGGDRGLLPCSLHTRLLRQFLLVFPFPVIPMFLKKLPVLGEGCLWYGLCSVADLPINESVTHFQKFPCFHVLVQSSTSCLLLTVKCRIAVKAREGLMEGRGVDRG